MPILQRGPAKLDVKSSGNGLTGAESTETLKEHVVIMGDDYERPLKEMDFPSAKLIGPPSKFRNMNTLCIDTCSKPGLHDRYMSSEEEPSPSPDSEDSYEEELKHKTSVECTQQSRSNRMAIEGRPEVAIAVPILFLGRPKLVDITNLAPMRKRKQRIPGSLVHQTTKFSGVRVPTTLGGNSPFTADESAKIAICTKAKAEQALNRKGSTAALTAPASWLPEDEASTSDNEHCPPKLDIRRTPSYRDYDPFSLDPPRLNVSNKVSCTRGAFSSTAAINTSAWKGLSRSLSLAKKQSMNHQAIKKPKMVARGANERAETLVIPPFPFESGVA